MKTKLIYNAASNTETIVPLTQEEIAEMELLAEQAQKHLTAQKAFMDAKNTARAKLKALGLTEIEIAALLGA